MKFGIHAQEMIIAKFYIFCEVIIYIIDKQ